jgi:hypothetical protein
MFRKEKLLTADAGISYRRRSLTMSAATFSLMGLTLLLSACSYGPAPPILIPGPMAPPVQKFGDTVTFTTIHTLPTQLPKEMSNVGILYKLNGEHSELITDTPLGPSLDAILVDQMKAAGLPVSPAKDPDHEVTLQIFVTRFEDKIKEKLVNTEQSGKIEIKAVMILHSASSTRTLTRTIERHRSPTSKFSFDKKDPAILLGSMYSEAIRKNLIPYIKKKIGEPR